MTLNRAITCAICTRLHPGPPHQTSYPYHPHFHFLNNKEPGTGKEEAPAKINGDDSISVLVNLQGRDQP